MSISFWAISNPAGRARNEKPVLMLSRAMLAMTLRAIQAKNAAIAISTASWIRNDRHSARPRGGAKRERRGGWSVSVVMDGMLLVASSAVLPSPLWGGGGGRGGEDTPG